MDIKNLLHFPPATSPLSMRGAGPGSPQHPSQFSHGADPVVTIDAVLLRTSERKPMAGVRTQGLALAVHMMSTAESSIERTNEWRALERMPTARVAAKMHVDLHSNSANLELSPGRDGNPILYPIDTARFESQFEGRQGTFSNFIQSYFRSPPALVAAPLSGAPVPPSAGGSHHPVSQLATPRMHPYNRPRESTLSYLLNREPSPEIVAPSRRRKGKEKVTTGGRVGAPGNLSPRVQAKSTSTTVNVEKTGFRIIGCKEYLVMTETSGEYRKALNAALNAPDYQYFVDLFGGTGYLTHYAFAQGKLDPGPKMTAEEVAAWVAEGKLPPGSILNEWDKHRYIYFFQVRQDVNGVNTQLYACRDELLPRFYKVSYGLPKNRTMKELADWNAAKQRGADAQVMTEKEKEALLNQTVKDWPNTHGLSMHLDDVALARDFVDECVKEGQLTAGKANSMDDGAKIAYLEEGLQEWSGKMQFNNAHNVTFSHALRDYILTKVAENWKNKDKDPDNTPLAAALYQIGQHNTAAGGSAVGFHWINRSSKRKGVHESGMSADRGYIGNQMVSKAAKTNPGKFSLAVHKKIDEMAAKNHGVAKVLQATRVMNMDAFQMLRMLKQGQLGMIDPEYWDDKKNPTSGRLTGYGGRKADHPERTVTGFLNLMHTYGAEAWNNNARLIVTNRYSDELRQALDHMGMLTYGPTNPRKKAGFTETPLYELIAYNFNLDASASIRNLRGIGPERLLAIEQPEVVQAESSNSGQKSSRSSG